MLVFKCRMAKQIPDIGLKAYLKHETNARGSIVIADVAMVGSAEEAVANLQADAGVGGPVFIDEAAVEEVGVACAGVDESGADFDGADDAVFEDGLVNWLFVVEKAVVGEGFAVFVADLI